MVFAQRHAGAKEVAVAIDVVHAADGRPVCLQAQAGHGVGGQLSAVGMGPFGLQERGSRVLLFVREFKSDRLSGGAAAYTFLGTATYVKHDGSRPMNITWRLDQPIPVKYLRKTNKLVIG